MTQRYAHLRDDALKQASNLAGDLVTQALEQQKKKVKQMKENQDSNVVNLADMKPTG